MLRVRHLFILIATIFIVIIISTSNVASAELDGQHFVYLPLVTGPSPDANGSWTGFLTQSNTVFSFDLSLTQIGSDIEGTSTIHSISGYYGIMSINGSISGTQVHLDEIEIIESSETPGFFWCIKSMDLQFSTYAQTTSLNGDWSDPGCNSGTVYLQSSNDPFISIAGSWSGSLSQPGTTFPFELSLSQDNRDVSGTSMIQNGSAFATMELTGFVASNYVLLQETSIVDGTGGNWCIKLLNLAYNNKNEEIQLDGNWNDPECNSGTVILQMQ